MKTTSIYNRIKQILESSHLSAARSVNTAQVVANWLIGRETVEEEQRGKEKAGYGKRLLEDLSGLLSREYGAGYSGTNLRWFRQFYLKYQVLNRTLLKVDKSKARAFYEIEAIKNSWSARELERQINSLLYERLVLSRNKKGLMCLATKGCEVQGPADT